MSFAWFAAIRSGLGSPVPVMIRITCVMAVQSALSALPPRAPRTAAAWLIRLPGVAYTFDGVTRTDRTMRFRPSVRVRARMHQPLGTELNAGSLHPRSAAAPPGRTAALARSED